MLSIFGRKQMEMSGQTLKCILHVGKDSEEPVKPLDSESWHKIQETAKCRLGKPGESKYLAVSEFLRTIQAIEDSHGYHYMCYKNFTAVQKTDEPPIRPSTSLRSQVPAVVTSSSGIFENVCLFCKMVTRRVGKDREKLGRCESLDAAENIRTAAITLDDQSLLTQILNIDFVSKEVKYHHSCRRLYLKRAEKLSVSKQGTEERFDETISEHRNALEALSLFVEEEIINKNGAVFLTSLHKKYVALLKNGTSYTAQKVEAKLLKKYGHKIGVTKSSNKKGKVIHSCSMSEKDASIFAEANEKSAVAKLVDAALILRQEIMEQKDVTNDLPLPITSDILANGNGHPSENLMSFFRTLFTGFPNPKELSGSKVERSVKSIADDVLYIVSNGIIKPGKHLTVAMGLKSMTGSRKIVEIFNRFGHCVGYHMVEILETEMATHISESNSPVPDGLLSHPGLHTGTAWDNYDENTETLSGKGTLHDTFGICYQDVPVFPTDTDEVNSQGFFKARKGRRSFQGHDADISPYRKKPKMEHFEYLISEDKEPANYVLCKQMDMLWMMGFSWNQQTPLWIGWNAKLCNDLLPQQKIGYMKNLTQPPTQLNVVAETLKISQEVAKACGEEVALVTYDLAIAKLALQIQAQETPLYDNVFVCFGSFHISLAYFACLGYLLDCSGGPYLLTETGVLAGGSLNGFISGKHFNRCKRIHPILALAFWELHFKSFCEKHPEVVIDELKLQIHELGGCPTSESISQVFKRSDFMKLLNTYDEYLNETRSGNHGKTAQFWITYVDLVNLYLMFSRAYRTCDLPLFVYCLGQMCHIFFAMNRPNYSRWMTLYYLKLINIDKTHPGGRKMLENGGLSIKRSSNSFSRVPVDMALEQTVNADAASRRTGISSFVQSESARRRWMITRSVRSAVVANLLEMANLDHKDEKSHETRSTRVQRDQSDVTKLQEAIESSLNPFSEACQKTNLFCISSGKAIQDEIACEILSVRETGKQWYQQFKDGCFSNADRFEKPIPRRKVKNFAAAAMNITYSFKDKKVKELKCTSDLFGRLLYQAATTDLDLKEVFKYPLTPVPLCFGHIDGSLNKTDKSKLLSFLEKKIDKHLQNVFPDVCIVDGMFFVQSLINVPLVYKDIALTILIGLCKMAKRVEFVCDTYRSPSIKDSERQMRGNTEINTIITGSLQKRPNNFGQALRSPSYKSSLLRFLAEEWSKDEYHSILNEHELYVAVDNVCYLFTSYKGTVVRSNVQHLYSGHEEADTRLIFHAFNASSELQSPTISVRASDTDVFVLLLHHIKRMGDAHIVMDIGNSGNNTRRFIDINAVVNVIGEEICKALPSFHAFTGCDYTAAFARKGKCRPLQLMSSSASFTSAFSRLGSIEVIQQDIEHTLNQFVCAMYGKNKLDDVDSARYSVFLDKYAPKAKTALNNIKGCDACVFPPSKGVLWKKLQRVNYVSTIWKNAHMSNPITLSPEQHGWQLLDGFYTVSWFSGHQMPPSFQTLDSISFEHADENEDDTELYASDNDTESESEDDDTDI